ncbi:MAG: YHS domain-containing protein [Candidatus Limnocylindrales bacterium]
MDKHLHMAGGQDSGEAPADGAALDPVCGMTVDITSAVAGDLVAERAGMTYYFCGRGCKLEFGDDPNRFLDPTYVPSM